MSQFNPKKLNIEAIHAGQRYPDTRSAFLPSDVNEIIESLYGISLGVENSAKRAFILSTPGNLIDISAVNKNIYFPKGTTIYADGYSDVFSEDKYVAFDYFVKLLGKGIVVYNKKTKTISIETDGFNSGSTYQDLYLFSFAYDDENNLVTDLPVEHLVNGEKQSSDRTIVKEPYNSGLAYINIDTKSYEIAIPEGTFFGNNIVFNEDVTYNYGENVENEEGYLYEIAIVYDRTEELIKSIYLYELYEHRNYAWLFTIRMDADKFVYCDLEAPFYVDGVLFDGVSSVEIVQETGESTTAVMSQKASTESFVPKVTNNSAYDMAYVTKANGTQGTMEIGSGYPLPFSLVGRQNKGQVLVGEPTEDRHAVSLGYANEHYVEKLPPLANGACGVYTCKDDGSAVLLSATTGTGGSIPLRGTGGVIGVGTPTAGTHAIPLDFADGRYVQITPNNSGIMQALVQNTDGTTAKVGINTSATDYTIARRYTDGRLKVAPPVLAEDATPRSYVDAVYRHDITLEGGFDYNGTTGYMACTVYSRKNTAWTYDGYDCTLTSRTTASGMITTLDGETHTIVGLAKGEDSVSYYIYYLNEDFSVVKFDFYDGYGTFTDTVTQMI